MEGSKQQQVNSEEVPIDNVKTDKVKVQESLEKLKITKTSGQQRKVSSSPIKSPRSPLPPPITSPSPTGRRNPIPLRSSNSNKSVSNNNRQQQQQQRDVTTKKPSPQSLRQRNSPPKPQFHSDTSANYSPSRKPQRSHFERSPRRNNESSTVPSSHQRNNRRSNTPNQQNHNPPQHTNGNHHSNRNRVNSQPNSNNSSPQEKTPRSEPATPLKYKKQTSLNSPLEQIENFSWANESDDELDKSASPKAQNPYTNSFLNFLAGGQ